MKVVRTDQSSRTSPSYMVAEFLTPDNKLYNFEQVNIFSGLQITVENETGHKMRLSFYNVRQPDSDYHLNREEEEKHVKQQSSKIRKVKSALIGWLLE